MDQDIATMAVSMHVVVLHQHLEEGIGANPCNFWVEFMGM
jgi:hypothetical protein